MEIVNPATLEVIHSVQEDHHASIEHKFKFVKKGQKMWNKVQLKERLAIINQFKSYLLEHQDTLANALTDEMGKPLRESYNEISAACDRIQYFLTHSQSIIADKMMNQDGNTYETISYEPLGVVANISAWNYPYLIGVNVFIPALICGNGVLYKPSEYATLSGLNIAQLLWESGVPEEVFQVVIGDQKVGGALLDLPLDGFFFTGSYATGQYIATRVADKLVPVGLELGGKDPIYVADEISDIKQVVHAVADGVFYNNGQSCCAVERIYVHEKVYDEFIDIFIEYAQNLRVGDPFIDGVQQGAIARPEHLEHLQMQVDDAIEKGAQSYSAACRVDLPGAFFPPMVLVNVDHTMSIMKEETFGPVIGIQKVKNDEEAIELMNDTEYGLTAGVFTSNTERGKAILAEINSGSVYLNCCDRVSPYLPWSGRGHSGLGSTLSEIGVETFCQPKSWHCRV